MSIQRLNERQMQAITKPGDYGAGGVPGFALRIYKSGKRSWMIRYRINCRARRMVLADCPGLDLKEARKLAAETYGAICRDRDPQAERKAARRAKKIATAPIRDYAERIIRRYMREYCVPRTRASTAAGTQRIFARDVVPVWKGRRLSEITKADVRALLDIIVSRGAPIAANRTLAALNGLMAWAVREDILTANPCTGIRAPGVERARDRALDDDELKAVWRAAQELPAPHGAVIRMLVLTGARLNEIGKMTWREIDFDRKLWTLPAARAKNGRALTLPLSKQALAILVEQRRGDSDFVFAVNGAPVANWSRMKRRLDELAGLPVPFVLHDLRRSTVTGLARIGIDLPVIERIVNHASGSFRGIVSTYQKYSFEPEMRKALDRWGLYVENLPRTIIARPVEAAIGKFPAYAGYQITKVEAANGRYEQHWG